MSGALVLAAALALAAQGLPPELRQNQGRSVDPILHPALRSAVEKASEAELDPKRGPGNAMEILKAARAEQADVDLKLALDLRIAATLLRSRFAQDKRLPETERLAKALSTYSRLDLVEPGFGAWLDRAIAGADADAKSKLSAKDGKRIRFHLTIAGSGIDAAPLVASLTKNMKAIGFDLVKASPAEADIAAKLTALEVRDEGGKAIVRASLDLAGTGGGEERWRKSLFRTVTAPDAKLALLAASDWLLRIGGRELAFHWLDRQGLEGAIMSMPGGGHEGHGHEGHGHERGPVPSKAPIATPGAASPPPKVTLPSGGREPAPAPAPKKRAAP